MCSRLLSRGYGVKSQWGINTSLKFFTNFETPQLISNIKVSSFSSFFKWNHFDKYIYQKVHLKLGSVRLCIYYDLSLFSEKAQGCVIVCCNYICYFTFTITNFSCPSAVVTQQCSSKSKCLWNLVSNVICAWSLVVFCTPLNWLHKPVCYRRLVVDEWFTKFMVNWFSLTFSAKFYVVQSSMPFSFDTFLVISNGMYCIYMFLLCGADRHLVHRHLITCVSSIPTNTVWNYWLTPVIRESRCGEELLFGLKKKNFAWLLD